MSELPLGKVLRMGSRPGGGLTRTSTDTQNGNYGRYLDDSTVYSDKTRVAGNPNARFSSDVANAAYINASEASALQDFMMDTATSKTSGVPAIKAPWAF